MHFKISSAICFNLDQSKILLSGNELNNQLCPIEKNMVFRHIKCTMKEQGDRLPSLALKSIVDNKLSSFITATFIEKHSPIVKDPVIR